jgi:hypothetical protein
VQFNASRLDIKFEKQQMMMIGDSPDGSTVTYLRENSHAADSDVITIE